MTTLTVYRLYKIKILIIRAPIVLGIIQIFIIIFFYIILVFYRPAHSIFPTKQKMLSPKKLCTLFIDSIIAFPFIKLYVHLLIHSDIYLH